MPINGYLGTRDVRRGAITPDREGCDLRNETGGTLVAGTLVFVSGYNASKKRKLVSKADADVALASAIYVVTSDVKTSTNFRGSKYWLSPATVDTSASAAAGDPAFLSATAGQIVYAAPAAPARLQIVGRVVVKSVTIGQVEVDLASNVVPVDALGVTQVSAVSLTPTQMKNLKATPITLVAGPGAGKFLEFVSVTLLYDYGGTAYTVTDPGDDIKVRYNNGAGTLVTGVIQADGFIDQGADMISTAVGIIALDTAANLDGGSLVIHNIGANEYADGNGPIRVKTSYKVHLTGF